MNTEGLNTGEGLPVPSQQPESVTPDAALYFQGVKPPDIHEWGYAIDRLPPTAERKIPVREVFPDGYDPWGDYQRLKGLTERCLLRLGGQDPEERDLQVDQLGILFPKLSLKRGADPDTLVSQVSEAYEFSSWGRSVRFYNFSGRLNPRQLDEMANALRAVGEYSGGQIFDTLDEIVVVPDGHPTVLSNEVISVLSYRTKNHAKTVHGKAYKYIDKGAKRVQRDGQIYEEVVEVNRGTVVLNANIFNQGQSSVNMPSPTTMPGNASAGRPEGSITHELLHILGSRAQEAEAAFDPGTRAPSLYAETNQREHLAETGTDLHFGGNWTDDAHVIAFEKFVKSAHSGQAGPTYVYGRELDLRHLEDVDLSNAA